MLAAAGILAVIVCGAWCGEAPARAGQVPVPLGKIARKPDAPPPKSSAIDAKFWVSVVAALISIAALSVAYISLSKAELALRMNQERRHQPRCCS